MKRNKKRKNRNKKLLRVVLCVLVFAILVAAAIWGNALVLRAIFQNSHIALVSDIAQEYDLDAYYVAAVVYAESGYDAGAISKKGAVGLMQIMPETGEWIAGHLGIEDYNDEMLKDPGTNLRMGCWYLRYLLKRYDADVRLALCAYNAGPGTVAKWLNDPSYSNDGKTIAVIPFEETRQYVDKVLDANEQYKKLYPPGGLGN